MCILYYNHEYRQAVGGRAMFAIKIRRKEKNKYHKRTFIRDTVRRFNTPFTKQKQSSMKNSVIEFI